LANLGLGHLTKPQQRNYVNFYGNLIKSSDAYLVQILDALEKQGLMENTLIIRTSDHGEMGMAHGGMRQKNFNFYEESLRVPLIYSNPRLFPEPEVSRAMVSHVDFLPTLASLFNAPQSARAAWQGIDYSEVVLDPRAKPPQDHIIFTFDDYQSGQKNGPYPGPLNHIVSIREERYELAKYDDASHPQGPYEWEMYDLEADPLETKNLAYSGYKRTQQQEEHYQRLQKRLADVEGNRLQPLDRFVEATPIMN
jgi:choline-sulfatase